MNTDYFYPLMLCFASGFTQCLLVGCSIFLLRRHNRYQFQRTFAVVLLMLAVGFFNNFVVSAFRYTASADYINTLLLLYDYVVVGGFMAFIVSLVFPGRYSDARLSLFLLPYVVATVLFALTRGAWVYPAVQVFTLAVSSVLLVWLELSIRRYRRLLQDNVSNIEYFDLHWGAAIIALLYLVQLIWAVESLSQRDWFTTVSANNNLIFDTLWCLITMVYVLFIMRKILHQEVFTVTAQEGTGESADDESPKADEEGQAPTEGVSGETAAVAGDYYKALNKAAVDALIEEKKYYLDPSLTLQKLAIQLGTNRQYLSNYINREKGKTFYEYINNFRMEEAVRILSSNPKHPQTMEEVATQAGFNTYSTFLRSFVKKYGESPSAYLKKTKDN